MRIKRGALTAIAVLAVAVATAPAQTWVETAKKSKPAKAFGDRFGKAVATTADTFVVGAPDDDNANGVDAGIALVFERGGSGGPAWTKAATLLASTGSAGAQFGSAVAIRDDRAIVGAPGSMTVHVFGRDVGGPGAWGEAAMLADPTASASSRFGAALALEGRTLIVGAPLAAGSGSRAGAAYVYAWAGGAWTPTAVLEAADGTAADQFGAAVALSGDTAFVGAPGDDSLGLQSGSVYVFRRKQGTWSAVGKLLAGGGKRSDRFGISLSASGDLVAVGAPQSFATVEEGAVFLFRNTSGGGAHAWTQIARLTASDGAPFDEFGLSVALVPERLLVGAWLSDGSGIEGAEGAAYAFTPPQRPAGAWSEVKLWADDGANGDGFGWAVAQQGGTAVVGAPFDGGVGSEIGSAYVFEWN